MVLCVYIKTLLRFSLTFIFYYLTILIFFCLLFLYSWSIETNAQSEKRRVALRVTFICAKKNQNIDAIAPSLVDFQDLPTIELIKLIQQQEIALSELLLKYKPDHPTIIRADQTIYNLKNKVLSNLKNLQKTLKEKTKSLHNMKNGYNKKLQSAPKQEQKLITFSRDYKVNEKMYLYLMQERSATQITYDKTLSRFRVIESIYTSERAAKPKKALIVIITFILVLLLMIFFAFFREFLKEEKEGE